MTTPENEILVLIRAAIDAEKIAADFCVYLDGVVARKGSVAEGSPAYDAAMTCFSDLNAIFATVEIPFTAYPTCELYLESNPVGVNGRRPNRLARYTEWRNLLDSFNRVDRAMIRSINRWLKVPYREKADATAYTILARYEGDNLPTNVGEETTHD
jgi:hypothetical protein